jgi:hypothetical protein
VVMGPLLSKQSLRSHELAGRALICGMTTTHQDIDAHVGVRDALGNRSRPVTGPKLGVNRREG